MSRITVVGHRGAAGRAPENTLSSFQRALDMGVDCVECDVRITLDGVSVLMHDETVDRTTNGTGKVAELEYSYIRQLEAGKDERVPTLTEVLDLCKGRAEVEIELKTDTDGTAIIKQIRDSGIINVRIISFNYRTLMNVMNIAPSIPRTLLFPDVEPDFAARAHACEADVISIAFKNLTRETVANIQESGFEAATWTPNTPEEIREVLTLGVDRITSDYPDRVLFAVKS